MEHITPLDHGRRVTTTPMRNDHHQTAKTVSAIFRFLVHHSPFNELCWTVFCSSSACILRERDRVYTITCFLNFTTIKQNPYDGWHGAAGDSLLSARSRIIRIDDPLQPMPRGVAWSWRPASHGQASCQDDNQCTIVSKLYEPRQAIRLISLIWLFWTLYLVF
jgi:hypothetical protein